MASKELTKAKFKDMYDDMFEMTNYAIHLAREQIRSGNEDLNVTQLLNEIVKHPPAKLREETAE